MIVAPTGIAPPTRSAGARAVPTVAGSEGQNFDPRRRPGAAHGMVLDQVARPSKDEPPYIDAEFVDVLREAATAARTYVPEDETLREALKAYETAAGARFPRGAMLDLDT